MVPSWFRRTIGVGDHGPDVDVVRRKLGLGPGSYDQACVARVRGLAGGTEVDARIAALLGESERTVAGLPPRWYVRELDLGDCGPDVHALRSLLGFTPDGVYDASVRAAVLRYRSGAGLPLKGNVDQDVAMLLGETELPS